jgi:SulP family sulfate permease
MRTVAAVALAAAVLALVQTLAAAALIAPLAEPVLPLSRGITVATVLAVAALALAGAAAVSTLPFAVLLPDPLFLALITAAVAAVGGDPATTLTLVAVALLVNAATALVLARRQAYRLIDLVPLPLLAGLMGAMGLVGIAAGLSLAGGRRFDAAALADPTWTAPALLALAAGGFLHAIGRDRRRPGVAAAVLVAVAAVAAAMPTALQPGPAAGGAVWIGTALLAAAPSAPDPLVTVPTLVALAVLGALATRVGVRGLEGETGIDATPRREYLLVGAAALVGLAAAAVPVALATGLSADVATVRHRSGDAAGARRARAVVAGLAVVLAGAALAGGTMARVPPACLGAFLVWSGLGAVDTWVISTARRAATMERLTLVGVLASILLLGPGYGLLIGTAAGAAAFALAYSRAKPVRARFTGRGVLSTVDRSPAETQILSETGDGRVVLTVRGFLFFGTADQLLGAVREEIRAAAGGLGFLILDFGEVDGADSSSVVSFRRLLDETHAAGVTVLLAQMSDDLALRLMPDDDDGPRPERFASIDEALERAERAALAAVSGGEAGRIDGFSAMLAAGLGADVATRILAVVTRERLEAGRAIVTQGAVADDLYFLESGSASVYLAFGDGGGRQVRVRRFGAGTMIGEIGFHLGTPRTATVVADEPCTLLKLSRAALQRLEAEDHAAAHGFHDIIARRLCRRILDKDHLVANLMAVSRR